METYLLIWNPKFYKWDQLDEDIQQLESVGFLQGDWSTGRRKNIQKGDRLFLIRLGKEPRGIVASGRAIAGVFEDTTWNQEHPGQLARYTPLHFDMILSAEHGHVLSLDSLKTHPVLKQHRWEQQISGTHIPKDIAQELELVWEAYLTQCHTPHKVQELKILPEKVAENHDAQESTGQPITVTQYKEALIRTQHITSQQKKLLQIQYNLPDYKATATQLAVILGVKRWTVINSLYGRLGHILSDEIGILPLKHTKTGKYEWWRIISDGHSTKEGFLWTLRPEFIQALEELKWVSSELFPEEQSKQFLHTSFTFRSGCPPKISSTTSVHAEKHVDISLRHNELQEMLYQELSKTYGEQNVGIEIESGIGTSIDLVVRQNNDYWFYEIKTEKSSRLCIRQALGQLLEYSLWPGSQEASRLIVVGEVKLDAEGEAYLSTLRQKYALPLEYHQIMTG